MKGMKAIVKNVWKKNKDGKWRAELVTVDEEGYNREKLEKNSNIKIEISNKRRCVGYWDKKKNMKSCPEFREIDSGSQCKRCRNKDIYSGFVEGKKSSPSEEEFSVYIAECGSKIKVGVARTERLEKRWVEQGADYAAEIHSGLSSSNALDKEEQISNQGISERIRKENKIESSENKIGDVLDKFNKESTIVRPQKWTIYPELECDKLERQGRFEGEIKSVKGHIISNGRQSMALTEGKVIRKPKQQGLKDF